MCQVFAQRVTFAECKFILYVMHGFHVKLQYLKTYGLCTTDNILMFTHTHTHTYIYIKSAIIFNLLVWGSLILTYAPTSKFVLFSCLYTVQKYRTLYLRHLDPGLAGCKVTQALV